MQQPSEREIAERAFELWEARGRPIGSPEQDWCDAELQLKMERGYAEPVTMPGSGAFAEDGGASSGPASGAMASSSIAAGGMAPPGMVVTGMTSPVAGLATPPKGSKQKQRNAGLPGGVND